MPIAPDVWLAIAGMGVASYLCRASGFWAMGFVRLTPRVRAWLASIPIAVLTAIVAPAIARAGVAETSGFLVAFLAMRLTGNDFVGALAGVAAVALVRAGLVAGS